MKLRSALATATLAAFATTAEANATISEATYCAVTSLEDATGARPNVYTKGGYDMIEVEGNGMVAIVAIDAKDNMDVQIEHGGIMTIVRLNANFAEMNSPQSTGENNIGGFIRTTDATQAVIDNIYNCPILAGR